MGSFAALRLRTTGSDLLEVDESSQKFERTISWLISSSHDKSILDSEQAPNTPPRQEKQNPEGN